MLFTSSLLFQHQTEELGGIRRHRSPALSDVSRNFLFSQVVQVDGEVATQAEFLQEGLEIVKDQFVCTSKITQAHQLAVNDGHSGVIREFQP